ncbi:MAG: type 4a pilus biogenesis protein PilO [Phycisphaeraceae bacterium]|nr:MAG: type 4a pilus biogenesis protein PilO [Phycisphaeraceae bacterium]
MRFGLRELLLLLVLLGVPVASFFLVFKPQNRQIEQAKSEVELKRTALAKLKQETARSDSLQADNDRIRDGIAATEAKLPSGKEVETVVRQVSDLAVANGLEPPSMKTARSIKAAVYMEQPLELSTRGDWRGFFGFMRELQNITRITRMTDMKIRRLPDRDGQMEATFTLSIYYQDEGAKPK